MTSLPPDVPLGGHRGTAATRRRHRQHEILAATRALFDTQGVGDTQIDDIAHRVGINRAIIYRHFTGKEELFALTLVGYLEEIAAHLQDADCPAASPEDRLRRLTAAFVDFGLRHPAFVDCALTLMRRTAVELVNELSERARYHLAHGVAACQADLVATVRAGVASGDFRSADAHVLVSTLCASALGGLQLVRVGMVVTETMPGLPVTEPLTGEQVRQHLVAACVAMAVGA
jgi:AcrR family transcriptional regulator